jgi:glycosyltransferase involved in cell wall biosynthesis
MKILQVCGGYSMGGLEQQTIKISLALQNKGHEVLVFCSADSLISEKCKSLNLPFSTGLFDNGSNTFTNYKNTRNVIKKFSPDIIHVQRSHDLFPIASVLNTYGLSTPLFFTRRMESNINKKTIIHRWIYHRIDKCYAISNFIKENLIMTTPINAKKIEILNNAVDLNIFDPNKYDKTLNRQKFNIPNDTIIIGMVGRISPMKGHRELIFAAAELLKNHYDNLFFVFFGGASVGEEYFANEIYQLADYTLPKEKFMFYEFTDSVAEALSTIDIFVFPSYRESFGNALLEAMAMQLPIVTTFAGGVTDIIKCNENALCVEPQNHKQIYEAIKLILSDDELKNNLALYARRTAENHSFDDYINKLERDYTDFIKNK